jgi:hypothetical protein
MMNKDAERACSRNLHSHHGGSHLSVRLPWNARIGTTALKNQEAQTWEQNFKRGFARAKEVAALSGQKDSFDRFFEDQAKRITEKSVTIFEAALDAASLIFSHSLLDTVAFDWCRVCALVCPDDFMP